MLVQEQDDVNKIELISLDPVLYVLLRLKQHLHQMLILANPPLKSAKPA